MGDRKKDKKKEKQRQEADLKASESKPDEVVPSVEEPVEELLKETTAAVTEETEKAEEASSDQIVNEGGQAAGDERLQTEIDRVLAEANDRYKRLAAEYENFRRRSQEEKDRLYEQSVSDVVTAWLPVVDNIERALAASEELVESGEKAESVRAGVELIYRQVKEVLSKQGVEEIAALGETFDPTVHAAVLHEESADYGHQEITEVFEKGWRRGEKVLRHSVVKVAN